MPSTYDFIVIGSGFGGSVAAMRLAEKGYRVLVLERGRRFEDEDFAKSNWRFWKYLWAPKLGSFGILQISLLNGVMVLHGSGVGGGSLGYANVLEVPSDEMFENPAWRDLADWKALLAPHYRTAQQMLGVISNPRMTPADSVLREIAGELGSRDDFRAARVGVFFGEEEGREVPDPYFGGKGPARSTCRFCGACMVGCRYNSKNTLVKNYLYFAEKYGARIQAESEVTDIRPLSAEQPDGARFEVCCRRSATLPPAGRQTLRARNVVVAAGVLGTLRLLFCARDVSGSLDRLSSRLGENVRTNSEELLGSMARDKSVDYSEGIAITGILRADAVTRIEPVRYPRGSSLMRLLSAPLLPDPDTPTAARWLQGLAAVVRHPVVTARTYVLPGWAQRTTILLVMQTEDNRLKLQYRRHPLYLVRRGLVVEQDPENPIPVGVPAGHAVGRCFAEKTNGMLAGSLATSLLNLPLTAHILGGCPFGRDAQEGVVGLDGQVHNYPGLYVVDGSIVPANPGVNPSLTITALAEYVMSRIPTKESSPVA